MKYDKITRGDKIYFRHRIYDPVTQKRKEITAKTKTELMKKVKLATQKIDAGVTDTRQVFSKFMDAWLKTVHLIDKKASTIERYISIFNSRVKDTRFGKIKLDDLTTQDLQSHYNSLFRETGSSNIVRSVHKIVAPCIRYAFETQCILRDISKFVKIPVDTMNGDLKENKVKPLTLDEQFLFIKSIEDHDLEVLFNVAIDTGMRQGELFALQWKDIDFEKKAVQISRSFKYVKNPFTEKREGVFGVPKTRGSIRTIPLPLRTAQFLKSHQSKQKEKLTRIGMKQDHTSLVFSTEVGTPYDSHNVLRRLKAIYSKIGMNDKTFHDLRHTYATRLFELGEQAKTVQVLLGHSNTAITLGTYTHVLAQMKNITASKIDNLYSQNKSVGENLGKK